MVGTFSVSSSSKADCTLVADISQAGTTVTDDAANEPVDAVVLVTEPFLISCISLITVYLHPAGYEPHPVLSL